MIETALEGSAQRALSAGELAAKKAKKGVLGVLPVRIVASVALGFVDNPLACLTPLALHFS